jgi:Pyruvate/2-oxoglutarate dehydrogenase complex, dehydrogenase (E1) component, eukaryotic type, alpha subunit
LDYVRGSGRPFVLEANVSRLHGHSSSSGANRVDEVDCIEVLEKKLLKKSWITEDEITEIRKRAQSEANQAHEEVRKESYPSAETVQDHTFADNEKGGVPGRDF